MKVGDLVRYKDPAGRWAAWRGIVLRCIAGTDKRKMVAWTGSAIISNYPERFLEVISEKQVST